MNACRWCGASVVPARPYLFGPAGWSSRIDGTDIFGSGEVCTGPGNPRLTHQVES